MKIVLYIAWRLFRSQWAGGEIRILVFALALAVAAATSTGLFTDRIRLALERQGSVLLGADAIVQSDHPLPEAYGSYAQEHGLQLAHSAEFPSMVLFGEQSQLAEIKAVSHGFPLRGELAIGDSAAHSQAARRIPASGQVWLEPRLANALGIKTGDTVTLGDREMRVETLLQRESSRGGDMFSFAPRVMMNADDLPSTGLIQFGSRVKYQLLLAGTAAQIKDFTAWITPRLTKGERVQDVTSARPEIRSALSKAEQFLNLSSTVSVILAMVAMFLAGLPYVQSSVDTYALMRCFGASRRQMDAILVVQTVLLALAGSLIGCLLGYAGQAGLSILANKLFFETLPEPSWHPFLSGIALGLAVTLAVLWPSLLRLRQVAALHILRRDLGNWRMPQLLLYLPGLLLACWLVARHAGNPALASAIIGGFAGLILLVALSVWGVRRFIDRIPYPAGPWQLGIAALRRRPGIFMAQVTGFSLGLSALILLALIRNDLMSNWQKSLPADAPNRFLINIQPDQIKPLQVLSASLGMAAPITHPMVRGRLVAINDKPLDTTQLGDERAKRLAEREFNLSWADTMQRDNRLLAGQWWTASDTGKPMLSLEQGIADSLKLGVGDSLTYDIGGTPLKLSITSLRKVEWDSMNANFFALTPPGVLERFPASYMSSFYLPSTQENLLNQVVRQFPNITVIDVAAILEQVRSIMDKMVKALQYVFGFSLVSGLAVLYASLVATRQTRIRESALLRVLGASRSQIQKAAWAEFALIGVLSAVLGILIANATAWYVSQEVLDVPYTFNLVTNLNVLIFATLLVPSAAWLVIRRYLSIPPRQILQSI